MKKVTIKLTVIAAMATVLTACSKTDLYDNGAVETNQKTKYADNFVKKYGAIDPLQSWDFTTGARLGITRADVEITTESISGLDFGFTNITKRYMFEDLGSTDDFDFNDIVVDVAEITETEHTVVKEDNIVVSDEVTGTRTYQKAWLRHLGGVLPFQLTIGSTVLETMQGVLGANPDTEFDIEGWNPNTNNISITVNQQNSNGVFTIQFPKEGEAPMIIAVDPSQPWMTERQSIPAEWIK